MHQLRQPYLLFLGDVQVKSDAKTAFGLRDWSRDKVVGEFALPEATVTLGLPRLAPREAAARGAGSLVIGVAPAGGALPPHWLAAIESAIDTATSRPRRSASASAAISAAALQSSAVKSTV